MPIQLFRIDDRLIHGQVVIGWVNHLHSKEIILCDDSVWENEWEKELYLSVIPETIKARVLNTDHMVDLLLTDYDLSRTIIVANSPFTIESLIERKIPISEINIGGIHFKEGRNKYLPYLYLSEEEVSSFRRCYEAGVKFSCQDMPENKKIPLEKILNLN
ncbi:MAG: PTS sugar transporter subunit IIB [Calditrichaceae bacterium]|nr:PTS sugar transporter subunit IIB [Calditrichaceae bacterium]MBN2708338.1 PTS sugar transporter subunit IIB [Calditrichaceae bacterium]RQV95227.1 MAG: PTS mannose/fructose/sorbose transporter subunit IIB [Calditrichota bacterium]